MTSINVSINGSTTSYPAPDGRTAEDLLGNQDFIDVFQLPDNVQPLINGAPAAGRPLRTGDTLTFQTKASEKASA